MPGNWEGSDRASRLPPDWPQRKKQVWARDGDTCHLCHQPGADRIDHIQPGDNHDITNLGPVHDTNPPHCHRYKSSREGNTARKVLRSQLDLPARTHPGLIQP